MKRIIVLFAVLPLVLFPCLSQGKVTYPARTVPENLSKGSDAVVRDYVIEYIYHSPTSAAEKQRAVITVFTEAGEQDALIMTYTDNCRTLKSFSAEILDANGSAIRKIKKSDLKFSDYFSGLASDTRTWYYEPKAASYPFTVVYEYEITHKDGIISFPAFSPVTSYSVGLERAQYKLTVPDGVRFHAKNLNTSIKPQVAQVKNTKVYTWTLAGLEPVDPVPYRPYYLDVFPVVRFTPHEFTYNKKSGTMDTWAGYSKWQWSLLEGRDVLPEEAKAKVRSLTGEAADDREKVAILYDYLKETRYVSRQIDIGGFQPMSATEVYNKKFGDCKGLSNYMMALLAECGVKSYYTEIGFGSRKLSDEYVHPAQTNHAILYVPLEDGDLWLECTNPNIPLGYVHSDITDRKALVYRDGTAVLVDMPSYPDSVNVSSITAKAVIDKLGNIEAQVKMVSSMAEYENVMYFNKKTPAEQKKKIVEIINMPLAEISGIKYDEEKSATPWGAVSYDLAGRINMSDARAYIPVNLFCSNPSPRLRRSRTLDIRINDGFRNADTAQIELPEGFSVEAMPMPVSIENRFGHFRLLALQAEGNVVIMRDMQLNKGTYSAEHYQEFRELMDKVRDGNSSQIVLVKK